jgi:hypothetical protein
MRQITGPGEEGQIVLRELHRAQPMFRDRGFLNVYLLAIPIRQGEGLIQLSCKNRALVNSSTVTIKKTLELQRDDFEFFPEEKS